MPRAIRIEEILGAARHIDPVFLNSPLLTSDALIAEKPKKEDKKGGGDHDDLY